MKKVYVILVSSVMLSAQASSSFADPKTVQTSCVEAQSGVPLPGTPAEIPGSIGGINQGVKDLGLAQNLPQLLKVIPGQPTPAEVNNALHACR